MPLLDAKTLSLADLESLDPQAPDRGRNRRFKCPLAGCDGRAKRDLSANVDTGEWKCHHCQEAGKLREFWDERPKEGPQRRSRTPRAPQGFKPAPAPPPLEVDPSEGWRKKITTPGFLAPLEGTPGEGYLAARSIPVSLAREAKVRYCARWEHWEKAEGKGWVMIGASRRVVFPIYAPDRRTLAAVQARSIAPDGDFGAAKLSRGEVSRGVFATPDAWDAETVALVEAPIDALSLAACGLPSIATMGCNLPEWVADSMHRKRSLVGTDADEAGDTAAAQWKPLLEAYGARAPRLRPVGFKDWNDWLCRDPEGLREYLAPYLPGAADLPANEPAPATGKVYQLDPAVALALRFVEVIRQGYELLAGAAEQLSCEELNASIRERLEANPPDEWPFLPPLEAELNEALATGDAERLETAAAAFLAACAHPPQCDAGAAPAPLSAAEEWSLFASAPPAEPAPYSGLQGS